MKEVNDLCEHVPFSIEGYDNERKRSYRYRVFDHLTSWKAYQGELCIVEIHEQLPNGTLQKSRWVFPQEHAEELLPTLVREVGHLRWQEEINEFKLANQHFDIKHILHHEPNAIEIFLFLKLFVLTFISLFLSQREPHLQKKNCFAKDIINVIRRWFVYGLHRISQYWLVLNYQFICLMIFLSRLLTIHEEMKRVEINICTMIDFCHGDQQCDPNREMIIYDSG
jgi:hypothetical protein